MTILKRYTMNSKFEIRHYILETRIIQHQLENRSLGDLKFSSLGEPMDGC